MGRSIYLNFLVLLSILLLSLGVEAQSQSQFKTLRDPNPEKVPCGIYLASLVDSTRGVKVADLTEESLRAFFASKPKLEPKLVYVDKVKGSRISDPAQLKTALETRSARPVVDRPALFVVGTPLWGKERREVLQMVESLLAEYAPDSEVPVKVIGRPKAPDLSELELGGKKLPKWISKCLETGCVLAQKVAYQFPLPQDYQTPSSVELRTTATKLAIANGIRTAAVAVAKKAATPWHVVINSSLMDAGNSLGTGVYEKTVSNWFNRSRTGMGRFIKQVFFAGFFTADIYWASRATLKELAQIVSLKGWGEMLAHAGPALGFNLLWRTLLTQSFYKWEQKMAESGQVDDARRTRSRLSFWATVVVTPGYVYSIIYPKWLNISVLGHQLLQLNAGHFWMLGAGLIGALYYFGVPKYNFTEKKWDRFSWDPWVARLDRLHEINKGIAKSLKLDQIIDRLEKIVRRDTSQAEPSLNGDIRSAIDMDHSIVALLESDADLIELIHTDPALRKLIEEDPHFEDLRRDLLGEGGPSEAPPEGLK